MGLVAGPEDVMSVETGSETGSIMTVRGRHLPSSVLTLKLHEEDWVLRKVRKGKLRLGSANRISQARLRDCFTKHYYY